MLSTFCGDVSEYLPAHVVPACEYICTRRVSMLKVVCFISKKSLPLARHTRSSARSHPNERKLTPTPHICLFFVIIAFFPLRRYTCRYNVCVRAGSSNQLRCAPRAVCFLCCTCTRTNCKPLTWTLRARPSFSDASLGEEVQHT